MILGFMQYFPFKGENGEKEPTNFREKILASQGLVRWQHNGQWYITDLNAVNKEAIFNGDESNLKPDFTPKIHTFRADPHNRWKAGMKVSMVYRGAGYKILDWFNEGIPELDTIKSIQKIKIKWIDITVTIEGEKKNMQTPCFFIDEKEQDLRNFDKIIINDGFSSMKQFSKWFKKDWSGKILHFTDFRYE